MKHTSTSDRTNYACLDDNNNTGFFLEAPSLRLRVFNNANIIEHVVMYIEINIFFNLTYS